MDSRQSKRYKILCLPRESQFKTVGEGNKVFKHTLVDKSGECFLLEKIAFILSAFFLRIEILPALHEKDIVFRNLLLPGVMNNKNPDFKIGINYWEVESPTFPYNYKKIDQRIRKGYQQANNIILYFSNPVNSFTVNKAVNDRFLIHKELKEVIIISGNKIITVLKRKPGKFYLPGRSNPQADPSQI